MLPGRRFGQINIYQKFQATAVNDSNYMLKNSMPIINQNHTPTITTLNQIDLRGRSTSSEEHQMNRIKART